MSSRYFCTKLYGTEETPSEYPTSEHIEAIEDVALKAPTPPNAPRSASGMIVSQEGIIASAVHGDFREESRQESEAQISKENLDANKRKYMESVRYLKAKMNEYEDLTANIQFQIDAIEVGILRFSPTLARRLGENHMKELKQRFEGLKLPFQSEGREGQTSVADFEKLVGWNGGLDIMLKLIEPDDERGASDWDKEQKRQRLLAEKIRQRIENINTHFADLSITTVNRLHKFCAQKRYTDFPGLRKSFDWEKEYAERLVRKAHMAVEFRPIFKEHVRRLTKMNSCLAQILEIIWPNDYARLGSEYPSTFIPPNDLKTRVIPKAVLAAYPSQPAKPDDRKAGADVFQTHCSMAPPLRPDTIIRDVSLGDNQPCSCMKTWLDEGKELYAQRLEAATASSSSDSDWEFIQAPTRSISPSLDSYDSDCSISLKDLTEVGNCALNRKTRRRMERVVENGSLAAADSIASKPHDVGHLDKTPEVPASSTREAYKPPGRSPKPIVYRY